MGDHTMAEHGVDEPTKRADAKIRKQGFSYPFVNFTQPREQVRDEQRFGPDVYSILRNSVLCVQTPIQDGDDSVRHEETALLPVPDFAVSTGQILTCLGPHRFIPVPIIAGDTIPDFYPDGDGSMTDPVFHNVFVCYYFEVPRELVSGLAIARLVARRQQMHGLQTWSSVFRQWVFDETKKSIEDHPYVRVCVNK